ncbi:MAG: sigma-70 family RNA polymerase sigma factor [Patescibacteria group bacterium]
MQSKSDEQFINDYFKGNKKSLEILIKKYLKPIYSFAYWYVGNVEDAEDVTQEVFVKIWRNLKKFNQKKRLKTWIFTIAKNTAIDFLKKSRKSIPFSAFENNEGENALAETLADPAPLPDRILERADIAKRLNSAIQQMSLKYQIVLFLRYNDQFNFREIAEALKEPLHTIKSRHRRAIIMLKTLLAKP